jgi:phenylacetate-CoA ligase
MEHAFFFDYPNETLDRRRIAAHQQATLTRMFAEVFTHNAFYRRKYQEAGWSDLPRLDDWSRFPFTTKAELSQDAADHPPYGTNLTYPIERYIRLHQTSGTTGKPLVVLDTLESWEAWQRSWGYIYRAAGVVPGDRIFVASSFGLFVAFWPAYEFGPSLGCLMLTGGGQTSVQRLRTMLTHQATVLLCTPSYALYLAEVARQEGIDLACSPVRLTIHAGEPGASIPSTKQRIAEAWGARCFDHIGGSEVGAYGFECHVQPGGVHVNELNFICEVIDPQTLEPVSAGEVGELVMTNLQRWAFPIIRYRTGDLVRVSPTETCACGRSFSLLDGGVLARADDMLLIRGVNVYPGTIESAVRAFPEITEFEGHVFTQQGLEQIALKIELLPEYSTQAERIRANLQEELRQRLGMRLDIEVMPAGSLPRYELKARRFKRVEQVE